VCAASSTPAHPPTRPRSAPPPARARAPPPALGPRACPRPRSAACPCPRPAARLPVLRRLPLPVLRRLPALGPCACPRPCSAACPRSAPVPAPARALPPARARAPPPACSRSVGPVSSAALGLRPACRPAACPTFHHLCHLWGRNCGISVGCGNNRYENRRHLFRRTRIFRNLSSHKRDKRVKTCMGGAMGAVRACKGRGTWRERMRTRVNAGRRVRRSVGTSGTMVDHIGTFRSSVWLRSVLPKFCV
jgi:hypothetical protein